MPANAKLHAARRRHVLPSHCEDATLPARCVCDPGYQGADCTECAPGFTGDATRGCSRAVPPGDTLLAFGKQGPAQVLVAIDPTTGESTVIRSMQTVHSGFGGEINALAADVANRKLYALHDSATSGFRLVEFDLASGALRPITSASWASSNRDNPLTFDSKRGVLFSASQTSYKYERIDVGNGAVTELATSTNISWAHSMAYEASSDSLLFLRIQGGGGDLYRVDPTNGTTTALTYESPKQIVSLAIEPVSQHLYAVAASDDDSPAKQCALLVNALGYPNVPNAPVTTVGTGAVIGAGGSLDMKSAKTSGIWGTTDPTSMLALPTVFRVLDDQEKRDRRIDSSTLAYSRRSDYLLEEFDATYKVTRSVALKGVSEMSSALTPWRP